MFNKVKNIILKTDRFLFKKFGSDKSLKFLENIKEIREIFSLINEIGKDNKIKFVGGCVRKSLSGEIIDDIDLATTLVPNEVKKKLSTDNIKVIDTGIEHGTLTVLINKKKFEITTLRKDISTDGRHAKVQFTLDWEQDSARRDFTINAIYADIDGRIFDPQNGISDLQKGEVKFIGSPSERIQEDYLRILRYFRFFTQYSKRDHDKNIIKFIKQNINGLNKISNERIFDELKKIISLKNLGNLFLNKESKEVILNVFPQLKYYERVKEINNFTPKLKEQYDDFLILGLLIIDQSNNYEYFCHKYKASNKIKNRFEFISKNFEMLKNKNFYSEENIKKLIYLFDKKSVKDLLLFSFSINKEIKSLRIESLIDYVNACKIPQFPISGNDLKKQGYEAGTTLGKKLKELEEKWIENKFVLDEQLIKKSIQRTRRN